MIEILQIIIPAVFALAGALLGIFGAQRLAAKQHRQQIERDKRASFREREIVAIQNAVALCDRFRYPTEGSVAIALDADLRDLMHQLRRNGVYLPAQEYETLLDWSHYDDELAHDTGCMAVPDRSELEQVRASLIRALHS